MTLKLKPPITVIIVCVFELLGLILLPSALLKESTKEIGIWYQIYIVITGFVTAFMISCLLKMKKLGIYLYFTAYAVHNIIAFLVGNWVIYVLIIPIVGAILLLPHIKKMS
ncbi:MAG: hypothetical protein NTX44_08915 [Ignavibacteriales bacterium]|nr:hypothetical protein [Ignavibacteriales bacterium]